MPALSYKARFVPLVVSGAKPHSIRARRRRPFKAGDVLMHYTAMRTKLCRKIRPDTICTAATDICVNARFGWVDLLGDAVRYPRGRLTGRQLERLAESDGFACVADFLAFFLDAHGGELIGQLIEWDPFAPFPGALSVGVQAVCTPQERALGADASAFAPLRRDGQAPAANPTPSGPRSPSNF